MVVDEPTTECRRTDPPTEIRWGTQQDFTALYEEYLDLVYAVDHDPLANGRQLLVGSIAKQLRCKGAKRVLDVAAGTGFPALDLAAAPPFKDFTIHCTDLDRPMLEILRDRVRTVFGPKHGVSLRDLMPNIRSRSGLEGIDRMMLDWSDIHMVAGTYDYVMCRGNSLVYADTWAGGERVASPDRVRTLLQQIATKVKPGGYLHVDAPRNLTDRSQGYTEKTSADGELSVWEEVQAEADCRRWRVRFKTPTTVTQFNRFSTLLTIDDIARLLKEMRFTETDPMDLEHERPGFGVIIARRPN